MKFLNFVIILVAIACVVTCIYAATHPISARAGEDCRWMYDRAKAASAQIGKGTTSEHRTAGDAEVSAWASLYLACREAQR